LHIFFFLSHFRLQQSSFLTQGSFFNAHDWTGDFVGLFVGNRVGAVVGNDVGFFVG